MLDRRWAVALACSLAINSAALAGVIYGITPVNERAPVYMEVSVAELFAPFAAAAQPEKVPPPDTSRTPDSRREPDVSTPIAPLVAANTADTPAVAVPAAGSGASQGRLSPAGPSRGPRVVYSPEPAYPENARQSGWQGTVRLRVLITAGGLVDDVQVATGSGHGELDRAAVRTVRVWRFSPALQNGQPIAAWVTLPVVFLLK